MSANNGTLTDVPGLRVGHVTDLEHLTGCTVVLCPPNGCVAGVDVRGSAPGTRETDLLRPGQLVERVHAVLLAGGSAFGLAAADGVMRFLEERGIGFPVGVTVVPIVPAAIIFDLAVGSHHVRPDAAMGYAACLAARAERVTEGSVGAGTGATVGKILGIERASKGGIGSASLHLSDGLIVAALMVVNALGDVVDPASGVILAGARGTDGGWANTAQLLLHGDRARDKFPVNTVIGVVATNARLDKAQATKVAQMAHDGVARAIRPAHTMYDGDVIFALAAGDVESDVTRVGHAAAEVVAQAIVRSVRSGQRLEIAPGEPAAGRPPARTGDDGECVGVGRRPADAIGPSDAVSTATLPADDPQALAEAVAVLRVGGLVAFPTDTVYGVGCHAYLPQAVERIYAVKERPPNKPIPLLLGDPEDVERVARHVPPSAKKLMARFWPGGLTLVVWAQEHVPAIVTAGTGTVALRLPDHAAPRSLARALGAPLAATSANLSGRPGPRTAAGVVKDLGGRIEIILDGGPCPGGVESTVVDMTKDPPQIIRVGAIPPQALSTFVRLEHRPTQTKR